MKCAQCGKEIEGTNYVTDGNLVFCNNLHKYYSKQPAGGSTRMNVSQPDNTPEATKTDTGLIIRKVLFGLLYAIVLYFLLNIIGGAIMGAIAGVEAGTSGGDASEAGKAAGIKFSAAYGLYILIVSIVFSTIGSVKGFLPGTKKKDRT